MIEKIDRACPPPVGEVDFEAKRSSQLNFPTQIASAKSESVFSKFFKRAYEVMGKMWDWLKVHIFFYFFDPEEERLEKLREEHKVFQDSFYMHSKNCQEADVRAIVSEFKKLSAGLQGKIKAKMVQNFKGKYPGKTDDFYSKKVDKIIEKNPFGTIQQNENDPYILMGASINEVGEELYQEQY